MSDGSQTRDPAWQLLAVGSFLYVEFNLPLDSGEPWHEFLVGPAIGPNVYVVKSPDDEFVMEACLSDDISGLRIGGPRYTLPRGLGAAHGHPVYRFSSRPTLAIQDAFLVRSRALGNAWLEENR